jgi:predicted GNAT superfamily acetyltransferase
MTRLGAGPAAVEPAMRVQVRALRSAEDYAACVRLQLETWGEAFAEYVPASLLKVGQLAGGISAGAFDADGLMVGFVFGLTGLRDGKLMHWSHMLAVRPEFRDHGVGRRLKEYQREQLRDMGIGLICWTFDPLVARNAHLNLNRLGAEIVEYVPDMYGNTGSPLHAFGTDRFVVAWPVDTPVPVRASTEALATWRRAPLVRGGAEGAAGEVAAANGAARAAGLVRVEVPADIEGVEVAEARVCRGATRPPLSDHLPSGNRVIRFYTEARVRCFYVVARQETAPAP